MNPRFTQLGLNDKPKSDNIRNTFSNIYHAIAGSDDYLKNQYYLKVIQWCVMTLSVIATGYVNAFAHEDRLGFGWSLLLAVCIAGFVECFYFTLRHGLTTHYAYGKQRFYALVCYRTLWITVILNVFILCAWIVKITVPPALMLWNNYSIGFHFGVALIGVSLVRDSDPVVENKILELKAERAKRDIVMNLRSTAIGNPIVTLASTIKGFFTAIRYAYAILQRKDDFVNQQMQQLDEVTDKEFRHIDEYQNRGKPRAIEQPLTTVLKRVSFPLPAHDKAEHRTEANDPHPKAPSR